MSQLLSNKQPNTDVMTQELMHQYLTFLVGKENFAINILDVKEIIEINTVTRVPMTPEYIRGVINLRGNVVPVIDLSVRLGRECSEITKRTCIVLVQIEYSDGSQLLGMLVDAVDEILDFSESSILPAPDFGADIRNDFIHGMGRVGDEFIILLDVNHVLAIRELSELKQFSENFKSNI